LTYGAKTAADFSKKAKQGKEKDNKNKQQAIW
jgi:hypothetical protein